MHHRQGLFWRETHSSGNQSPQLLNVSVGSGAGKKRKKRGPIPAVTELPRGKHEILNTVIAFFFPKLPDGVVVRKKELEAERSTEWDLFWRLF